MTREVYTLAHTTAWGTPYGSVRSETCRAAEALSELQHRDRHAVAFVPQIRGGSDEAKQCAQQLNALIDNMAGQGWTFSHLEDITTLRNNGCIASMAGNATSLVTFQVAIFQKQR